MSNLIKHFWHSFKTTPDIWFFYMFLATFTFSIRKVLYIFPINNSFNEYTGVYIYLSDIFLILTFLFYILYNIKSILSNIKSFFHTLLQNIKLFHVEQLLKKSFSILNCSTWNNCKNTINNVPRGTLFLIRKTYTQLVNNYLVTFPLFLAFFSFLSILWTTNTVIALFKSIKLLEYILLYFYIAAIVPRGTFLKFTRDFSMTISKLFHVEQFGKEATDSIKTPTLAKSSRGNCSTWNILLTKINVPRGTFLGNALLITIVFGLIQAIIGIIQFLLQHSIGLFLLKESLLSPAIPGVAKVIFNNQPFIRVYGLFPHPNILGGYLVFSIILSLLYLKMFHVEHFQDHKETLDNNVPRGTLLQIIIAVQCATLFLTFSKSAIFGLLIGLFYISYVRKDKNVPRGTFKEKITLLQMFHVEHFRRKFILMALIFLSLLMFLKPNINSLFLKSLQERGLYLNVSYETFITNPLFGVGAGQFVVNMKNNYTFKSWQYQPVHNVFLLIGNEYGVIMLIAFIFYLITLFKIPNCSTWNNLREKNIILIYLKGILLAFIFIMLFDHYLWDIQQGQIPLWILFALIASQHKKQNVSV